MYFGTQFLRNRPALELMGRLIDEKASGSMVNVAVLGCSVGAEVYSILWTLRRARPDLEIVVHAADISADVLQYAETGVYGPDTADLVQSTIFERLSPAELREMFDWDGDHASVKVWLREGIVWQVADACDPSLVSVLGPQDLVVASNFLCHMDAQQAETCLRNLARLVKPSGGYLFVTGVDLDVRTRVARELGWQPLSELRSEIHDGDPLVRADWPWKWWGLEPLDRTKRDWEVRYASVFQTMARERAQTVA
jgi:chemotaxis methyl-accepting protein methylase